MPAAETAKAEEFVSRGDIVGLFQYLGPMWLLVCMEVLEDMCIKQKFIPNYDRYRPEVNKAGINVGRMVVAMSAALHKVGQSMTWEKFADIYAGNFRDLPEQQRGEIKNFWFQKTNGVNGSKPGKGATAKSAEEGENLRITHAWSFDFEQDLEVGSYRLPNGTVIPLPPRGKYWPKQKTTMLARRSENRFGKVQYGIVLVPRGTSPESRTKFIIDWAAESMLSKGAAIFIGGITAPILAGAAAILVPSDIGETFIWKTEAIDEPTKAKATVYGVTSGFNVSATLRGILKDVARSD